jgi:hypothetical protein
MLTCIKIKGSWGHSSVVKHLTSMCKALPEFHPQHLKRKKKKQRLFHREYIHRNKDFFKITLKRETNPANFIPEDLNFFVQCSKCVIENSDASWSASDLINATFYSFVYSSLLKDLTLPC